MARGILHCALLTAGGIVERLYPDLAPSLAAGPVR